jgi:hypothetical protein
MGIVHPGTQATAIISFDFLNGELIKVLFYVFAHRQPIAELLHEC